MKKLLFILILVLSFPLYHFYSNGTLFSPLNYDNEVENKENAIQLGKSYYYGINGKNVDYDKAKYFFLKADQQNDVRAQYSLGTMFFTGKGDIQDDDKAIFYFQKSCDNGLSKGCDAVSKIINFKNNSYQQQN